MWKPFDKAERDTILRDHAQAQVDLKDALKKDDDPAYDKADNAMKRLKGAYFDGLPRAVMSTCPFCTKPLLRTFDPFGLEGMWWRSDVDPAEPASCTHFCLLRGAVNFQGKLPRGGAFQAHTGPE